MRLPPVQTFALLFYETLLDQIQEIGYLDAWSKEAWNAFGSRMSRLGILVHYGHRRQDGDFERYFPVPSISSPRFYFHQDHLSQIAMLYQPHSIYARTLMRGMDSRLMRALLRKFYPSLHVRIPTEYADLARLVKSRTDFENPIFSFSVGTLGDARKVTILVTCDGDHTGIIKVGDDLRSMELIKNECNILKFLEERNFTYAPKVIFCEESESSIFLMVTRLSGSSPRSFLSTELRNFVERLNNRKTVPLRGTSIYPTIKRFLQNWSAVESVTSSFLEAQADNLFESSIIHGDLAPWNLRVHNGELSAFDWEYASRNGIYGIDVWHYYFNTAFLLKKKSPAKAVEEIPEFLENSRHAGLWGDFYSDDLIVNIAKLSLLFDLANTKWVPSSSNSELNDFRLKCYLMMNSQ